MSQTKVGHTPKVIRRGHETWALEWPDGYQSAMPDEATARRMAGSAALLEACRDLVDLATKTGAWDFMAPECGGGPDEVNAIADRARAAIAQATGEK